MTPLVLSPAEGRVLGVLVEKEKTVPDTYPLSLNALVAGCNQKNARDPLMALGEGEVQQALDGLRRHTLVIESSGARVTRYAHNAARGLRVPEQAVALLATLLLRGPQTAAELRINSERLHRFADVSSVEAFLEELATRPDEQGGPLVQRLARRPGEREARWAQRLTGAVADRVEDGEGDTDRPPAARATPAAGGADELAALRTQLAALADEVRELRAAVAALTARDGQES